LVASKIVPLISLHWCWQVPQLRQTLVHTQKGDPYAYDGLSAMLKRAQKKAKVASFGFRDLKGKGATDMWLAGEPIERIQLLTRPPKAVIDHLRGERPVYFGT
jgi:hypothetical protein